jgi:hypothetical protein
MQRDDRAHREAPERIGIGVGAQDLLRGAGLVPARDPQLVRAPHRALEPDAHLLARVRRDVLLDQLLRRLAQRPHGVPPGVAHDHPVHGIPRVARDSRDGERARVRPPIVPVRRRQEGRATGDEGIEQGRRRRPPRKEREREAAAANPRCVRVARIALGHHLTQPFDRRNVGQVALAQLHAGAHRVHVRIDEARHQQPIAQRDDARVGPDQRIDPVLVANVDDAVLPDGDRARFGLQ